MSFICRFFSKMVISLLCCLIACSWAIAVEPDPSLTTGEAIVKLLNDSESAMKDMTEASTPERVIERITPIRNRYESVVVYLEEKMAIANKNLLVLEKPYNDALQSIFEQYRSATSGESKRLLKNQAALIAAEWKRKRADMIKTTNVNPSQLLAILGELKSHKVVLDDAIVRMNDVISTEKIRLSCEAGIAVVDKLSVPSSESFSKMINTTADFYQKSMTKTLERIKSINKKFETESTGINIAEELKK